MRELISTSKEKKEKKNAGGESIVEHSPQNPRKQGKKPAPMETITLNERRHKDNGPHVQ